MAVNALGVVLPGTKLYLPFHTFDSNDPSASVTLTGLATTDIEVYKDGSVTQRSSDAGFALLDTDGIDFDTIAGIHGISIDLADNTDAGFYEAGSQYWVVISSVTVDAATINFVLATFTIGYPSAILNTTIATLSSQTSFTLEEGSADNDAYNGCIAYIHDVASAVQVAIGMVSDYTGATKTVTLAADPGIFTMAAGDNFSLFPPALIPGTLGRTLSVDANSRVDVGSWLGTAVTTSATTSKPEVDVNSVSDDASAANNLELDYDGTGYAKANSTIGTCTTNTDMRGTDSAALASVCTEARLSELDAATAGKMANQVDIIEADTTALNDTKIPDTLSLANINAEVDTALADVNLDHIAGTATGIPAIPAGTYLDQIMDDGVAVYDRTTDSLQAIRDRGDSAWTGAAGITDILNVVPVIPTSIDLANTATVRLGLMLTNAVDDLPSLAEITPGTISIHRKAIGGTSWTAVVTDAACSEQAGLVYYDEVFDSGTGYAEGDSIRLTFKSQKITVAANDYEVFDATGVMFQTEIRQTVPTAVANRTEMDSNSTKLSSIETDTQDLQTQIGAAGAGLTGLGGMSTTMKAQIEQEVADALDAAIPGSPTANSLNEAIKRLARSVGIIQECTIDNTSFTATTTQAQIDAVDIGALETTDDHYNGRVIIFTSGSVKFQATDITDYDGTNKRFTYTALTEAPANDDTFIII